MASGERGALLHDFPQTFSIKNWPFLAMLAFMAAVPAYGGYASDHLMGGLAIGAGILLVPTMVLLVQVFGGFFVARITSAWEQGLVVRRFGGDTLVPWGRVKAVQLRSAAIKVAGVKVSNQYTVTIVFDDGKTHVVWPMAKGAEAAVELAARAGVKVEALD